MIGVLVALFGVTGVGLGYAADRLQIGPRRRPVARVLVTGVFFGLVLGVLGFLGPIVFMPEANQGPLLGIFVTGPFGLVNGLLVGTAWVALIPSQPADHPA